MTKHLLLTLLLALPLTAFADDTQGATNKTAETATELITGGVSPQSCGSNADYQLCQMELQLEKERIYEQAARTMDATKVLIVCDRGVIDNKAYMTQEEFETVLKKIGMNETELRDRYDGVFHLVTAAKGAEDFYTTSNNAARRETIEEAVDIDNRLISAWTGHPHLRVIDNHTGFEEKMKMLISEIAFFLGEPEPLEIERKYLIEYPDLNWLEEEVTEPWKNLQKVINATFTNGKFNTRIFANDGANAFQTIAKNTRNIVDDISDTYDDVKNLLTAEPGKIVHKTMKVSDIKRLIKDIEFMDRDLSDKIKMLNNSVSDVKKMAKDLSEKNLNNKSGANSVAVVFVQCITNISKGLLLIAQIHVRVLNRLYMTMGDDHLSKSEED